MTAPRCGGCGHYDTAHRPKTRTVPAYCAQCKGAKALHEYTKAVPVR